MAQGKVVYRIRGDNSDYTRSISEAESVANKAATQIGGAFKAAGAAASAAFISAATLAVKYNANIEQSTKTFEGLLQSETKAKALMNDLQKYAQKTSFEVQGLTQSAERLLAYGLDDTELVGTIKTLGDLSMGSTDRLQGLALALGQVKAKGHLATEELRQMQERGFNPLEFIMTATGESMAQLTKRLESGGISYAELTDAMQLATSAGQKFYNMTSLQSQTLIGKWNELKEAGTQKIGELAVELNSTLSKLIPKITKQLEKINLAKLNQQIKNTITSFKLLSPVIAGAFAAFGAYKTTLAATVAINKLHTAWTALGAVMSTSPVALAATAIAGLTVAIGGAISATRQLNEAEQQRISSNALLNGTLQDQLNTLRDLQSTAAEEITTGAARLEYTQNLANELLGLADATGVVADKDKARVEYILGELNTALGTEYTLTGNQITQYAELKNSVADLIAQKQALVWINANEAAYEQAILSNGSLYNNMISERIKLTEAESAAQQAQLALSQQQQTLETEFAALYGENWRDNESLVAEFNSRLADQQGLVQQTQDDLLEQQRIAELATEAYQENSEQIIAFEQASAAFAEGNYAAVAGYFQGLEVDSGAALSGMGEDMAAYREKTGTELAEAIRYAQQYADELEQGLPGRTEAGLQLALNEVTNKVNAFESAGGDIVNGVMTGVDGKSESLVSQIQSLASRCEQAFKVRLDIRSPSRVFKSVAEEIPAGAAIGVKEGTPAAEAAVSGMAEKLQQRFAATPIAAGDAIAGAAIAASTRTQSAANVTLRGDVYLDGYKVGEQVMRNFDDVAALTVGGLNL